MIKFRIKNQEVCCLNPCLFRCKIFLSLVCHNKVGLKLIMSYGWWINSQGFYIVDKKEKPVWVFCSPFFLKCVLLHFPRTFDISCPWIQPLNVTFKPPTPLNQIKKYVIMWPPFSPVLVETTSKKTYVTNYGILSQRSNRVRYSRGHVCDDEKEIF